MTDFCLLLRMLIVFSLLASAVYLALIKRLTDEDFHFMMAYFLLESRIIYITSPAFCFTSTDLMKTLNKFNNACRVQAF